MATSVGFQLEGGRIPGERIATEEQTSDSATFTTTESVVVTLSGVSVVVDRTYRVRFWGQFQASGDNSGPVKIRFDDENGNILARTRFNTQSTSGVEGLPTVLEVEFTATATEDVTLAVTGQRDSGADAVRLEAAADRPSYLYVDYIRG